MTSLIGTVALAVLVIVVAAKWLMEVRHGPKQPDPDIDYDELSAAEREVQELDSTTGPDEADEQLRDWGPGAPG